MGVWLAAGAIDVVVLEVIAHPEDIGCFQTGRRIWFVLQNNISDIKGRRKKKKRIINEQDSVKVLCNRRSSSTRIIKKDQGRIGTRLLRFWIVEDKERSVDVIICMLLSGGSGGRYSHFLSFFFFYSSPSCNRMLRTESCLFPTVRKVRQSNGQRTFWV